MLDRQYYKALKQPSVFDLHFCLLLHYDWMYFYVAAFMSKRQISLETNKVNLILILISESVPLSVKPNGQRLARFLSSALE